MFIEKTDFNLSTLKADDVFFLLLSSNQVMASFKGRLCGAKAYLVGYRLAGGFNIFAYLFFPEAADSQIFTIEAPATSLDKFQRYQYEGMDFLEAMGFLLETANVKEMSVDERRTLINSLPFSHHDKLAQYVSSQSQGSAEYLTAAPPAFIDSSRPSMGVELPKENLMPDINEQSPLAESAQGLAAKQSSAFLLSKEELQDLREKLGLLLASF